MLSSDWNQQTQSLHTHPVFNNWNVVAKAWYFAFDSKTLKKKQIRAFEIGRQRLVIFRGEDGQARALDSFCPHMGTDLLIGKVKGNDLQCFFHHWKFNGRGECVDIPCQKSIPDRAQTMGYAVKEIHGGIWVYPDRQAPEFPRFEVYGATETVALLGKPYLRNCHHHIAMVNGIDPQHLKTVHNLDIEMQIDAKQSEDSMAFELSGELPNKNVGQRLVRKILGHRYTYSVAYSGGSIGLLTTMKQISFFGRKFPCLTMLYAYKPTPDFKTLVQPIYIAKKRKGFGKLLSSALMQSMKFAFYVLKDEDGKVYDNIRFNTEGFLPMDRPVARFISYINQLHLSKWSAQKIVAAPTKSNVNAPERILGGYSENQL